VRLRWTPEAADDLEAIYDYLVQNRPDRASSTIKRIHQDLLGLRRFPLMGRLTERREVRALLISELPYICVYSIRDEAVILLHIFHTSQDRPAHLQ
jgi:toxin ParE1/3/4